MKYASTLQKVYCVALFFIITLVLIKANYFSIFQINFEAGDFAANSLLIQDAKSFNLWVGNYSRLGFYHPGPAILYVLALGEIVFYDLLHLVPSPLSGQLVAASLYCAFWITAMAVLFKRITSSFLTAACSLLIFLMLTLNTGREIFGNLWFPHLYYYPFAVLTLALARLASGHTDSVILLAFSAGFLMNGHVSFIPMCGIMGAITLLGNHLIQGQFNIPALTSRIFLKQHKAILFSSCGILFLFFIPLAIETIIHFPGSLKRYFDHGTAHYFHPLSTLEFVLYYWGAALSIGPITAMWLAYFLSKGKPYALYVNSMIIGVLASSGAVLFYALFGVDNLSLKYIGIFYYSTPAIAAATSFDVLYKNIPLTYKQYVLFILMFAGFIMISMQIIKKTPVSRDYNRPEIPFLSHQLESLDAKPVALFLDKENSWERAWPILVGIEIYQMRRNKLSFCIDQDSWHILFMQAMRCTPEQLKDRAHFLVKKSQCTADDTDCLSLSFEKIE